MVATIDILEDVNQKFTNTIVMYNKKAAIVKTVAPFDDKPNQFGLKLGLAGSSKFVNLLDPLLNYQNFSIGYANTGYAATWWYRKPYKQWSQGLKSNQMGWCMPVGGPSANFGWEKSFIKMLENEYPTIQECKTLLANDSDCISRAFHKDFALSYDKMHEDFILEYRGVNIGISLDHELRQFKLKPEFRHLVEALQEARDVHA